MRRAPKTLAAVLVALLLAVGVIACGGDDSDSTTASQQQSQTDSGSQDGAQGKGSGPGESDSSSGDSDGGDSQLGGNASDFVPKEHDDSGGGSDQFKVKGGDNSIQEFGEEADSSELEQAAAAVHNFLDARAAGNSEAACEYMSASIIESFEKLAEQAKQLDDTSCAGILEKLTNPAAKQAMKEEATKADVRSLRIEDDGAFVIYTGVDGTVFAMPMANEDGDWKVASLAGTPLS